MCGMTVMMIHTALDYFAGCDGGQLVRNIFVVKKLYFYGKFSLHVV